MGKAGQEPALEVGHPQQPLHVQLGHGRRELLDGRDLLREGPDPLKVHLVTKEGHSGLGEDTFVQVHRQVILLQTDEDLLEVVLMVLEGGAAHQDIIYITKDECNVTKNFMDNPLKCTPTVP